MYFFEGIYAASGSSSDADWGRVIDATWDSPMATNWSSFD